MVFAVDITPLDLVTKATFAPIPVVLILLSLGWYLWSLRRLTAQGREWPVLRTAAFLLGELALAVALVSGLASYADTNFSINCIQHVLIGMLAPILFALSAPVTLALQANRSRPRVQATIAKVIESRPVQLASHPAVSWPAYGGFFFVLYLTPLYSYGIDHALVRQLIELATFVVGWLFFCRPVGADQVGRPLGYWLRMLYFILLLPCHTVVGMILESQSTRIVPRIGLTDLHTGGGLLWVAGEATGLLATIAVFVGWLRSDERAAQRGDQLDEATAAAALAHWRATREAAARAASR